VQRKYPIIYVRGYAARQSSINDAADDPFYGFNEGSTHVRTGLDGKVAFYQFEGPLLGLIRDHGYELKIRGSQEETLRNSSEVPSNTIWIYRFYDPSADTFANRTIPYEVGDAACKLADLVRLIHQKTKSPVYLVAHSMGGLICRAAIQAVLQGEAEELVAKLVTIGTPHGGIDPVVLGVLGPWLLANFGPFGSKIFSPDRMREYLLPDPADNRRNDNGNNSEEWDPRQMVNFDVKRVLSIVGTNANDYEVAAGLARSVMGPKSDGLVAIRNAYVKDSARAYIHRSHSGRWGEVNSEEAYQNIRRFLFGGLKLQLDLSGLNTERLKGRTWQADVRVLIRGESVVIHEQTAAHFCPVDLNAEAAKRASSDAPIPLVSVFLLTEGRDKCRFAVDVKVTSLDEEQGIFRFNDHLEQVGDWQDTLLIDVHFSDGTSNTEPDKPVIRWEWNSELLGRIAERHQFQHPAGDEGVPWLPLPLAGKALLGDDAAFHLTHQPWE
jgi:pimeloyl-ACP methyl ester carboxylesterase